MSRNVQGAEPNLRIIKTNGLERDCLGGGLADNRNRTNSGVGEVSVWIIPKNLDVSVCVRDTLESSWDLDELSQICEQSLMWRSKPSLARTWLQRLKKVGWMQHLSGRILKPLMASRFATEYTLSLAVIPANHSVVQDNEKGQTTLDTFGRILKDSFAQLDLFGASSKTSQDTLRLDSPKFTEAYEIWVTKLRQDCLTAAECGAPHKRERLFILANGHKQGLEGGKIARNSESQRQKTQTTVCQI